MNRQDLFNKFLKDQGADPLDCEILDDVGVSNYDPNGCLGFVCPDMPETRCDTCTYNGFWTKEIAE